MKFNFFKKRTRRIHLDYASATPIQKEVVKAMVPFLTHDWANPSAVYEEGVRAKKYIEEARAKLADMLRVRPTDCTFTSGGTESNNLALMGSVETLLETVQYQEIEILTTAIEHPSILETCGYLAKKGVVVTYVPVDGEGRLCIEEFKKLLNPRVRLCTFAYVNSEIGVIQDLKKITRIVRKWNEENNKKVLVHTDASQAPLWLPCALDTLGVDLMTLDAGKCYGPKSAGVLVHRHWVRLLPTTQGGGQEHGLRSGTESAMLVVGCVHAILSAQARHESRGGGGGGKSGQEMDCLAFFGWAKPPRLSNIAPQRSNSRSDHQWKFRVSRRQQCKFFTFWFRYRIRHNISRCTGNRCLYEECMRGGRREWLVCCQRDFT
jgi:cysteine desulfurase